MITIIIIKLRLRAAGVGVLYLVGVAGVEVDTYKHARAVYRISHQNQEVEKTIWLLLVVSLANGR